MLEGSAEQTLGSIEQAGTNTEVELVLQGANQATRDRVAAYYLSAMAQQAARVADQVNGISLVDRAILPAAEITVDKYLEDAGLKEYPEHQENAGRVLSSHSR